MIHALLLAVLPAPALLPQVVSVATTEPPAVEGEAPDSVLEVYDLRPLMPRYDSDPSWTWPLVLPPGDVNQEGERTPLSEFFDQSSPDVIVDLLTQVLGDELRYEGREIAMDGESRLLVLAPVSIQKRVASALSALEGALTSSARIVIDVLEIEGPPGDLWPTSNVVPGGDVDRAVASVLGHGGTHRRFHVSLAAGRTALLDQMRQFPILYDYDVEIAQGSFISDPTVVQIEEGVRLLLRGVPQPGGIAISAVFQAAEVLDVEERALEYQGGVSREDTGGITIIEGPKALQVADLLNRSVAFDSFLPQGKAIAIASQVDLAGARRTQVVYLRQTGGELAMYHRQRLPDTTQSMLLVNSEALSLPTMGVDVKLPGDPSRREGHPGLQARLAAEPSLFLFDWMKFRFSVWRRHGPWAVVVTDPAWDNDAATALDGLLASWQPRASTVDLEVGLFAGGGSAKVPVRWSLPVRLGSDCGLLLGISSSALYDFDVEVAQFSSVPDPVLTPLFDGLCLGVTSSALADGRYSLAARGSAQLLTGGPRPTFDPRDNRVGPLDQPRHDALLIDAERSVTSGTPMIVGGETKEGERPVLRLEVGVR